MTASHKQSGTRRIPGLLACGCHRTKLIMCDVGVELFRALREAFPEAMWSGDWKHFDEIREVLEAHLRHDDGAATQTG